MASKNDKLALVLFEELEQECLQTVRYLEALKVERLSRNQRDDLLGELSASITHLRTHTDQFVRHFEELS